MDALRFMRDIFANIINRENVDKFVEFYDFFTDSAKKFNLTSVTEEEEVYAKHFADSLSAKDLITENAKVVEIGSGGGFPSVPLKIERPDLRFTLIEATGKKCRYLQEVASLLEFENFCVVNARCEDLAHDAKYRAVYDFAVARAVAPLNILLEYLIPFLKVGGKALCYKGSNYEEELTLSENALKTLGASVTDVVKYDLPLNYGKRAVIVVTKNSETKPSYPRMQGKIKKAPL